MTLPETLDRIAELAAKAHEAADACESWEWSRSYGMGREEDGGVDFHWCLMDPDGDSGRTLDLFTVTLCSQERGIASGERFCDNPVPALIAALDPATVLRLVAVARAAVDLDRRVSNYSPTGQDNPHVEAADWREFVAAIRGTP